MADPINLDAVDHETVEEAINAIIERRCGDICLCREDGWGAGPHGLPRTYEVGVVLRRDPVEGVDYMTDWVTVTARDVRRHLAAGGAR